MIRPIEVATSPARKTKISWIKKDDLSSLVDHDRMAIVLGVESPDHFRERIWEAAIDNDYGPDLTEEERDKCVEEFEVEQWRNYESSLMTTFEEVCKLHHLTIVPLKTKKDTWRLVPEKRWTDALEEIRQTINGVGSFYFNSVQELLSSGPYTPRAAVLCHIGCMSDHYRVYGNGTSKSVFERRLR